MQHHRWQPTRLPRPWDSPGKNTEVVCHFLLPTLQLYSLGRNCRVVLCDSQIHLAWHFSVPLIGTRSDEWYSPCRQLSICFVSSILSRKFSYRSIVGFWEKPGVKRCKKTICFSILIIMKTLWTVLYFWCLNHMGHELTYTDIQVYRHMPLTAYSQWSNS